MSAVCFQRGLALRSFPCSVGTERPACTTTTNAQICLNALQERCAVTVVFAEIMWMSVLWKSLVLLISHYGASMGPARPWWMWVARALWPALLTSLSRPITDVFPTHSANRLWWVARVRALRSWWIVRMVPVLSPNSCVKKRPSVPMDSFSALMGLAERMRWCAHLIRTIACLRWSSVPPKNVWSDLKIARRASYVLPNVLCCAMIASAMFRCENVSLRWWVMLYSISMLQDLLNTSIVACCQAPTQAWLWILRFWSSAWLVLTRIHIIARAQPNVCPPWRRAHITLLVLLRIPIDALMGVVWPRRFRALALKSSRISRGVLTAGSIVVPCISAWRTCVSVRFSASVPRTSFSAVMAPAFLSLVLCCLVPSLFLKRMWWAICGTPSFRDTISIPIWIPW